MIQRHHAILELDGQPLVWLGCNFWSRAGGPLMWRSYDPKLVREELGTMQDHGLGMTRSFFYWPDFQPTPDTLDEEKLGHFADFLDAHVERGMTSVPTFIVGHMSGENWDPAWRNGRDLYSDVWLVARQAWFIEQVTRRFADHPAITGWLISNEMPIYGRRFYEGKAPTADVSSWAQLVVNAVRAGGGNQPVSLGDGAWGVEVTGENNGYSSRETAHLVDFVGPHVYRMESDVVRQHLNAGFICELSAVSRKPVVLEEFGVTDEFVSQGNARHYYRQTLHNSLLGGATGWIAWNNTDFENLIDQDPYRYRPYELHFGLTETDGTPKGTLQELAAFAKVLEKIDLARCTRVDVDTALVVSSYLERGYPFSRPEDSKLAFAALRQGYVAAKEACLPIALTREEDGIDEGARLYLLPSTRQLTAPTWHQLRGLAEAGATVYLSYCAGDSTFQRASWIPNIDESFGIEHQLLYGMIEPIEDDVVELTFTTAFGSIGAGEVLRFRAGGDQNSRSYLPVVARGAEVLASDAHGRPALLRHRVGSGSMILSTYPLEHMASQLSRVNPEPTWRIYEALADEAGVSRDVRVDDPAVFTDVLVHEDGRRFAWFVSQHADEQKVTPRLASGRLADLQSGELIDDLVLPAYGVSVFELRD